MKAQFLDKQTLSDLMEESELRAIQLYKQYGLERQCFAKWADMYADIIRSTPPIP